MAWLKKSVTPPVAGGKIENVLGANSNFEGLLRSDGNIRIDGVFSGRIETAGNVLLGPSARVMADIVANVVQVWGSVQGNIKTHGRLEILSNGRVWGDIEVAALLIDEGGMFRGQCLMAGESVDTFTLDVAPSALEKPKQATEPPTPADAEGAASPEPAAAIQTSDHS